MEPPALLAADLASVAFADASPVPEAPPPSQLPSTIAESSTNEPHDGALATSLPRETADTPVASSAVERWTAPHVYTSTRLGVWTNAARDRAERLPHGSAHFGLQLEGGGFIIVGRDLAGGLVGMHAFADITTGPFNSFRIGVNLSYAPESVRSDARSDVFSRTLGVGLRLSGGADAGNGFFRCGLDLNAALLTDAFAFEGGVRLEAGLRLLDHKNLEIGVGATIGLTPTRRELAIQYNFLFPQIELLVGWVLE